MINHMLLISLVLATATSFAKPTDRFENKIVGGVEASIGEFPFIVSLQTSSGSHFCGGSLIRKDWVLTAAHCVQGGVQKVVIGLHDRSDAKNAETFKTKKVIAHPQYNDADIDYDFALIQLDGNSKYQPVHMNDMEIEIPDAKDSQIMATTAGWGTMSEGAYALPKKLQKVDVPLVTAATCDSAYPGKITDRMLCAGLEEGGKDSCQGDSGGPLVAEDNNRQKYLIGVVSWGYGCARPAQYGVYSKVSSAHSWIMQTAN